MRIVFVPSPTSDGGLVEPYVPLGLVSLATVLGRAGGFEPVIHNINARAGFGSAEGIAWELLALEPDVLGFSCLGGSFPLSLRIAACCRSLDPRVRILFGGPQPTVSAESTVRHFPCVDAVVRGECEHTIVGILGALGDPGALAAQPGVTFMNGDTLVSTSALEPVADISLLPDPEYAYFPDHLDLQEIPVEVGRGCPHRCRFCCIEAVSRRSYRCHEPDRIVALMARLCAEHPLPFRFRLLHDTFNHDRAWALALCRGIANAGLGVHWSACARIDRLDPELLEAMVEAGCDSLFFGLESASPRLQGMLGKSLAPEVVERALRDVSRKPVQICLSNIIGFPDETREEMLATLEQALRFRYQFPGNLWTQIHVLAPLTGSPLYQEFQGRLAFDGLFSDFACDLVDAEMHETVQRHPDMFSVHHYYPLQHLNRELVTRGAYLFYVLFAMRYGAFWLCRDPAFRFPGALLDSPFLGTLPNTVPRRNIGSGHIEGVIRFLCQTFPELEQEGHPLLDLLRYDLALERSNERGHLVETFAWDVQRFAAEAQAGQFGALPDPRKHACTLLFQGSQGRVHVRRLEDAFAGSPV